MKEIRKFLILGLVALFAACSSDDDAVDVVVSTSDLEVTILDNAMTGDVLGVVAGSANVGGSLTFAIVSQSPSGALAINAPTGQVTIADASLIDAATNPEITASVSVTSGDVSETSNVTVTVNFADFDGDGVLSTEDTDDMDPCSPAQAIGYTGFDADNTVWAAADCDGDGNSNGDEVTAGTDPYDENDIPCDSADTSAWAGDTMITLVLSGFGSTTTETFENRDNVPTSIAATCGMLVVTDPLRFGSCDVTGDMPDITFVFTPDSAGATSGTVEAEAQNFTCGGDTSIFTANGTYDEVAGIMEVSYTLTTDFGPFTGTYMLTVL